MANELLVGIQFGASVGSTFSGVFGTVKNTLQRLGQESEKLSQKHDRLGKTLAQALAHPMRNVGELQRRYVSLGRTLEELNRRQITLAATLARNDALRNERKDLRGEAMETLGTGAVLLGPMMKSVRLAGNYEDGVKDIAITGEMSNQRELQLGKSLRNVALDYNQDHDTVTRGVGVLVAEGMEADKAEQQAAVLAKAATATRATIEDLASMTVNFDKVLNVKDIDLAFNQAAKAGKQGSFELRDMARWFPALGGMMKSLGVEGNEAVVSMASRLQIARRTAGNNDEAANNFKNFLNKLTSPDTQKDFQKLGVDLQSKLIGAARRGVDPIEAGINTIMEQMTRSSPAAAKEMQKLAKELDAIKDPAERAAEMERRRGFIEALGSRAGLSEMFQDMQAMSYLLAEIQNRGSLKEIMEATRSGTSSSGRSVIDEDFERRMTGFNEQSKKFWILTKDIGITLGNALLPSIVSLVESVTPVIKAFGEWAEANPGLVRGLTGLVAGLIGGKLAFIALRYGINLVLSSFTTTQLVIQTLASRWTLLRAMWQAGQFAPVIRGLGMLRNGFTGLLSIGGAVLRGLGAFSKGVAMFFIAPLKLAGQAILWLGRAMLLTPIGAIITALAVAGYLVWRNWDTVKSVLIQGYQWVKGLHESFVSAGADLIEGLVQGVTSRLDSARESIVNFGGSIKNWFCETLGINSPSKVFIGFGGFLTDGLVLGISDRLSSARDSIVNFGGSIKAWFSSALGLDKAESPPPSPLAEIPAALAQLPAQGAAPASAGMTVHFSPVIHVQSGGDIRAQVQSALTDSYREFEANMRRYEAAQSRRAYA